MIERIKNNDYSESIAANSKKYISPSNECRTCHGNGRIFYSSAVSTFGGNEEFSECMACNGTGELSGNDLNEKLNESMFKSKNDYFPAIWKP